MRYRVGDRITLLGPWQPGDPIISEYQYHGNVSVVSAAGVYYRTGSTMPPDLDLGPFPADRIRPGWLTPAEARR